MKHFFFYFFLFVRMLPISAQPIIVGFYNFENLYDTVHQFNVNDEEFLPNSEKAYTAKRYAEKTKQLSRVLYQLGKLEDGNGFALLGVAEIENKYVLEKILTENAIKQYQYQFVHINSKDPRGIDVGLIYHPTFFKVLQYKNFSLSDSTHFTSYATRDILYVKGVLGQEKVHLLINHWPSRRGGSKEAIQNRIWAASWCKRIMDSINKEVLHAKWIVMGDFNDNPTDRSVQLLGLYNPFLKQFKRGMGSLAFRDSWNLFDQLLINRTWFNAKNSLTPYKSIIYKNKDMIETEGKYQGYPKRTWDGNEFRGGFSDHFPVALIFSTKKVEKALK